jgi:hypothetical protein
MVDSGCSRRRLPNACQIRAEKKEKFGESVRGGQAESRAALRSIPPGVERGGAFDVMGRGVVDVADPRAALLR